MNHLTAKAKNYLSNLCGLSNLTLLSESEQEITFKVNQKSFIESFRKMQRQFGQFQAYPADTSSDVSQIDAVWKIGPLQHIVFVTELTDTGTAFFVTLLNDCDYKLGASAMKLQKAKQGFDALTKTPEWKSLGQDPMHDASAITQAAKRVKFI